MPYFRNQQKCKVDEKTPNMIQKYPNYVQTGLILGPNKAVMVLVFSATFNNISVI
jgi:hypothetical protein